MPKVKTECIINDQPREGFCYGAFFMWALPKMHNYTFKRWNVTDLRTGRTVERAVPFVEARAAARRLSEGIGKGQW